MSVERADDIVKLAGGLLALATALIQVGRWYRNRRQRARLEERLGKKKYAV